MQLTPEFRVKTIDYQKYHGILGKNNQKLGTYFLKIFFFINVCFGTPKFLMQSHFAYGTYFLWYTENSEKKRFLKYIFIYI